jgi:transposase
VVAKKRGSYESNKKLYATHVDFIRARINLNCTISLGELQEGINREFGVIVSKSAINRSISSFKYTLKRLSLVPEKRNDPDNIESRFVYASWLYPLSQQGAITFSFWTRWALTSR